MTTEIDVGPGTGAWNSFVYTHGWTYIDVANPCNATGYITRVDIQQDEPSPGGMYIGIFRWVSGTTFTTIAWSASLTASSAGVNSFTGLQLACATGDYIGFYADTENYYMNLTGGSGVYYCGGTVGVGSSGGYNLWNSAYKLAIYGYGTTRPAAPTSFAASENSSTQVTVTWGGAADSTNVWIYRDSVLIAYPSTTAYTYADTGAAAPTVTKGSVVASDGTSTAHVALSVTGASANSGTNHYYTASSIIVHNGTYISSTGVSDYGRRVGTLSYQWERYNGSTWDIISSASSYNDTGAPAPTITGGTAAASDGTSTAHVALSISGQSANVGATKTYRCYLTATGAAATTSATNTGYRAAGTLTYQWERSAADSDADYSSLSGATASTYNDTKIPYPERRYYRCYLTSSPATAVYSAVNSGYTAYIPRIIFL